MSFLFGGAAKGGAKAPPSLTESIFGVGSSSSTAATSDLFASKPTAASATAQRQPSSESNAASASRKRSRSSSVQKGSATGGKNERAPPSREETLRRRRQQCQGDVLDQLTISLGDYRGGINDDELYGDVRGLMKHHGLVIIRNALSDEQVTDIASLANATRRRVCDALDARGLPYDSPVNNDEPICFSELAVRCRGRMDVRYTPEGYDNDDATTAAAAAAAAATTGDDKKKKRKKKKKEQMKKAQPPQKLPALPLIDNLAASVLHGAEMPNLVYAGWIFSFPGSADQPWHQDGSPLFEKGTEMLPSYALNFFCGLHDDGDSEGKRLNLELGPTEFVVGSHHMEPERAMGGVGTEAVVSAVLGRGDILLYDYRICHRGTSNLSSSKEEERSTATSGHDGVVRKVLYLMFARPWFREHLNFGEKSLFE